MGAAARETGRGADSLKTPSESEGDLVERAKQRDPLAIRTLTTRYNRRLFRIARSILHHDDEVEDVVQAAYLKAFTGLGAFHGEARFGTWLTRILINEALGLLRRRRSPVDRSEDGAMTLSGEVIPFPLPSTTADPERSMAQRQIQMLIEKAIDELPAAFRTVLVARVLEEMSLEETAELLGLKPETVKTRLHRPAHCCAGRSSGRSAR